MSVSIALLGDCVETWLMAYGLAVKLKAQHPGVEAADIRVIAQHSNQQSVLHLSPDDLALFAEIGISERELVEQCNGQFSLGYSYSLTATKAADSFFCWGSYGFKQGSFAFHQLWTKARLLSEVGAFHEYCFAAQCAASGKFVHPQRDPRSVLSQLQHSIVIDAEQLKALLIKRGTALGVGLEKAAGNLSVELCSHEVTVVVDATAGPINADVFLDFTGDVFAGLGEGLQSVTTAYNTSVALRLQEKQPKPHSCLTSNEYGWVRCDYLGDEKVVQQIFNRHQYDAEMVENHMVNEYPAADSLVRTEYPDHVFNDHWKGNVLLCGSRAAGPGYFIAGCCQVLHRQMQTLLELLPRPDVHFSELALLNREYNYFSKVLVARLSEINWLHADTSPDDPGIRANVQRFVDLFQTRGHVMHVTESLLSDSTWAKLLIALGVFPKDSDPLLDGVPFDPILKKMAAGKDALASAVTQLPPLKLYREHY